MYDVTVEISPSIQEIKRAMKGLEGDLSDWKAVWRQLVPIVASEVGKTIKSRGAYIGVFWPAIKQASIRRRKKAARSRAPLISTRKLFKKVSTKRGKRSLTKRQLVFGVRMDGPGRYQSVHQFGSAKRNIPARPFLGITDRMRRSSQILIQRHADAAMASMNRRWPNG